MAEAEHRAVECPSCRETSAAAAKFCNRCGFELVKEKTAAVSRGPALKACNFCAEEIRKDAIVCRFCGREQGPSKGRRAQADATDDLCYAIEANDIARAVSLLPPAEQSVYHAEVDRLRKHIGVSYLFWFFMIGAFGAQKFYLREYSWGTLYLCCTVSSSVLIMTAFGIAPAAKDTGFNLFVLGLLSSAIVCLGLFLDVFCIPSQVNKYNDRVRKEILIGIAQRLRPNSLVPQLPRSSLAFSLVAGIILTSLITIPLILHATDESNSKTGIKPITQNQSNAPNLNEASQSTLEASESSFVVAKTYKNLCCGSLSCKIDRIERRKTFSAGLNHYAAPAGSVFAVVYFSVLNEEKTPVRDDIVINLRTDDGTLFIPSSIEGVQDGGTSRAWSLLNPETSDEKVLVFVVPESFFARNPKLLIADDLFGVHYELPFTNKSALESVSTDWREGISPPNDQAQSSAEQAPSPLTHASGSGSLPAPTSLDRPAGAPSPIATGGRGGAPGIAPSPKLGMLPGNGVSSAPAPIAVGGGGAAGAPVPVPAAAAGGGRGDGGPAGDGVNESTAIMDDFAITNKRYMEQVQRCIRRQWFPPKGTESKRIVVTFKVHSNGDISDLSTKQSSGEVYADNAALSAVEHAAPLPPLPPGARDTEDIVFSFDYNVHGH